jgi:hypothetical protein
MSSTSVQGDGSHLSPAQETPRVRFEQSNIDDEEEQAKLRRGSVSKDLRNQIALRGIIGRNGIFFSSSFYNRKWIYPKEKKRKKETGVVENECVAFICNLWRCLSCQSRLCYQSIIQSVSIRGVDFQAGSQAGAGATGRGRGAGQSIQHVMEVAVHAAEPGQVDLIGYQWVE